MKKLIFYIVFILFSIQVFSQTSPVLTIRVVNLTTAFGTAVPFNTTIIAASDTTKWLVVNAAGLASSETVTSALASGAIIPEPTKIKGSTQISVTGTNGHLVLAVPDNTITNAKLANMATGKVKGRTTTGTGVPEDISIGTITENVDGLVLSDSTRQVIGGATVLSVKSGRVIPTATNISHGESGYDGRIATFTTTGSSGSSTFAANTLNIPTYTLAGLGGIATGAEVDPKFATDSAYLKGHVRTDLDKLITNEGSLTATDKTTYSKNIHSNTNTSTDVVLKVDTVAATPGLSISRTDNKITLKNEQPNIPTALSEGTRTATTYGITSDGGADDIILPRANTNSAGLLNKTLRDSIIANSAKVTNATHTGDVTGATELTITPDSVGNASLANMATKTYKGRTSSGTGNPEDVGVSTMRSDLSINLTDNTSDANKPVSTAQQSALDLKVNLDQTTGQTIGATGARLTKLWATDVTVTNPITGSSSLNVLKAGDTMTGGITNSTSVNPLTTKAESWIGPSSTAGVYFKGGKYGFGNVNPTSFIHASTDGASYLRVESSTNAGVFVARCRGTVGSPTILQDGDYFGWFASQGYNGAGYSGTAEIDMAVDGTFTSGQRPPSRIEFYTNTANGSQTLNMVIKGNGNSAFGYTDPGTYRIKANGTGYFNGALTSSSLNLFGATSGTATIVTPSVAKTPTLTLPNRTGIVSLVVDSIRDGKVQSSPTENVVYDNFALKAPISNPTFTTGITTPAIKMTTSPTAGYFLQSDADGNGTWTSVAASQVYKGTWDADTNTPTLADGTGTAGWYYRVSVAGTVDFDGGGARAAVTFYVGDDCTYNGSIWERIPSALINGLALTKTDDTNVTVTLGGSPTTALLAATSMTLGWTGTLASSRGGTGNGFTKFSGPATAEKTFTLPDASSTILTTNDLVTVAQGGTHASTKAAARDSLGLTIGTNVLAYRTFGTAANNATGDFEVPLTFSTGLTRTGNTITNNITQYTDALARLSLSSTATGLTYTNTSGVFSLTSGYAIPTTTNISHGETAYDARYQWNGGSTELVAATGRTSLGGTTIGQSYFTLTNSGAITFPRQNADNTVSSRTASEFRGDIGAAAPGDTHYIGTTQIALNRASAAQSLTGITSIDGSAAKWTAKRRLFGRWIDGSATMDSVILAIYGGTGQSSYAVGDLLYASSTTALSKLAAVAAGQPLISDGIATIPKYAGYTFAGTAAQTYTFPSTTSTLMSIGLAESITGAKTFDKDKILMKGTGAGTTTLSTANASGTSYTATLQAATGTIALTSDITGTNSGTNTGDVNLITEPFTETATDPNYGAYHSLTHTPENTTTGIQVVYNGTPLPAAKFTYTAGTPCTIRITGQVYQYDQLAVSYLYK